jgi:hypothetical protein
MYILLWFVVREEYYYQSMSNLPFYIPRWKDCIHSFFPPEDKSHPCKSISNVLFVK